jgi:XTP/dITP diphosphohydrolase
MNAPPFPSIAPRPLVVATSNRGKLQELQTYLTHSGWELCLKPPELEIAETGATFAANAALKASGTAIATGKWALADDSGLEVAALNGGPGVYSARYANTDAQRIDRLLGELAGQTQRQARFVCAIAIAQPDGSIAATAEGVCDGEILLAPVGTGGFGYDPIFYVPDRGLTFAEMPLELKQQVSHRGRALAIASQHLLRLATTG